MFFSVLSITGDFVQLQSHDCQPSFEYDIRFILSPTNQPIDTSKLAIGDILQIDQQNYMHMLPFTTNRLYETSLYLNSSAIKRWLAFYFPFVRPFEENSFNSALDTKILEFTYLNKSDQLLMKIKQIAPELEETLNFYLNNLENRNASQALAGFFCYFKYSSSITGHCLPRFENKADEFVVFLNIKLKIITLPRNEIFLINPVGEIEFTFLQRGNKYELLYTLQEKRQLERVSNLTLFENFRKIEENKFCLEDFQEKVQNSQNKIRISLILLEKLIDNATHQRSDRSLHVVKRASSQPSILTPGVQRILSQLKCIICSDVSQTIELDCSHRLCVKCFVKLVSQRTRGLFVLNKKEGKAEINCQQCRKAISEEFIKTNLPGYDGYQRSALDRLGYTCETCKKVGDSGEFLTDCRHNCISCSVKTLRTGDICCGKCKMQFSVKVIEKFMKIKQNCEGCKEKYLVKSFNDNICKHNLCLACIKDIFKDNSGRFKCFFECPERDFSLEERSNLLETDCLKCRTIICCASDYWEAKQCQCRICVKCSFGTKSCSVCQTPFTDYLNIIMAKINQKKNDSSHCIKCEQKKTLDEFTGLTNCNCKICKSCFETLIENTDKCPACAQRITAWQLERFVSPAQWKKMTLKNTEDVETCPKCGTQFEAGCLRRALCTNKICEYTFCRSCKELFHEGQDCEDDFIQKRTEKLNIQHQKVTQCPMCRHSNMQFEDGVDYCTCLNPACKIEFCIECACVYSPVKQHGNHYHRPDCKLFKMSDGTEDVYKDSCDECKRLGKLCSVPNKLIKQRFVDKFECVVKSIVKEGENKEISVKIDEENLIANCEEGKVEIGDGSEVKNDEKFFDVLVREEKEDFQDISVKMDDKDLSRVMMGEEKLEFGDIREIINDELSSVQVEEAKKEFEETIMNDKDLSSGQLEDMKVELEETIINNNDFENVQTEEFKVEFEETYMTVDERESSCMQMENEKIEFEDSNPAKNEKNLSNMHLEDENLNQEYKILPVNEEVLPRIPSEQVKIKVEVQKEIKEKIQYEEKKIEPNLIHKPNIEILPQNQEDLLKTLPITSWNQIRKIETLQILNAKKTEVIRALITVNGIQLQVAVKSQLCPLRDQKIQSQALYMAKVQHNNLFLRLYGAFWDEFQNHQRFTVLMELAKESLADKLSKWKNENITKETREEEAYKVSVQIIEQMEFLNRNNISHRDIKPANILIMHDGSYKIADFDISREVIRDELGVTEADVNPRLMGTRDYFSPELNALARGLDGGAAINYNISDVYSLGITALSMVTNKNFGTWNIKSDKLQMKVFKLIEKKVKRPDLKELVKLMMIVNPEVRLKFRDLLQKVNPQDPTFREDLE